MSAIRLLTRFGGKYIHHYGLQQQQQAYRLCLRPEIFGPTFGVTGSSSTRCVHIIATQEKQHGKWHNVETVSVLDQFKPTGLVENRQFGTKTSPDRAGKSDSKASAVVTEADIFGEASKLGLFAKYKLIFKKYWYVMVPVYTVTSLGWFGGFYYMSKSGVDIAALLQYIHLSEAIIEKVHDSDMGHLAVAYLCYKVATPVRYAVTLGGTTLSIKYLVQSGYIKPMPSKQEFMQMYEQKKADIVAAKEERKAEKEAAQNKETHEK